MSDSINTLNNSSSSAANNAQGTSATSDSKATAGSDSSAADADGSGPPDAFVLQQGKLFRSLMADPDEAERRSGDPVRGGPVPARQRRMVRRGG